MLIEFKDGDGTPLFVNPQFIIAVREVKHFGRPGVSSESEYRDTLILTTRGEFNVRETPDAVAREVNRASLEMLTALGRTGAGGVDAPPDRDAG
jgi:hypothetical protein